MALTCQLTASSGLTRRISSSSPSSTCHSTIACTRPATRNVSALITPPSQPLTRRGTTYATLSPLFGTKLGLHSPLCTPRKKGMDINERLIVRAEAAEIAVSEPIQSASTWQGAKPIPFAISVGVGLLLRFAIPGQLSPSQNVGHTCDRRDVHVKGGHLIW